MLSFLRRVLRTRPAVVIDLPDGGYVDVAGETFHQADLDQIFHPGPEPEISDVPATLRRAPRNRYDSNAVEVRIQGRLAGYIPRELAAEWSSYLAPLEAAGRVVSCQAHVWRCHRPGYPHGLYYVNVRIASSPRWYLELAERERRRADEEAAAAMAKVVRADERAGAASSRVAAVALKASRKSAGLCVACGGPIAPTSRRGRPPIRCDLCRGQVAPGA